MSPCERSLSPEAQESNPQTKTYFAGRATHMPNQPSRKEISMNDHEDIKTTNLQRRTLLKSSAVAMIAGWAGSAALTWPVAAQHTNLGGAPDRNNAPLGARLQGAQHFGLTVQNMDRAFEFYTEVLGGAEIMRDGDFQGESIQNTLMTDQEIEARARRINPRTFGVPDLKSGAQRLDVRFVQFDNFVVELLQYLDAEQPAGTGASFAEPVEH